MSNELRFAYGTTGRTVTALLFDASGNVWNGSALVPPSAIAAAAWANGAIACPEQVTSDSQGTGNYVGSLPSGVKLSMVDAALFFDGTLTITSVPVGVQQFDPVVPVVTGISSLANWLRAMARSDAPDATAKSEINASTNGIAGTFDPTKMSEQAIAAEVSSSASGGFTCTVQTNDSEHSANPVPGVTVYAMSAASGGTLVGGPAVSNSGGAATIVLQDGTQWIWQLCSGYATPAPYQVTITAATTSLLPR